MFTAFLGTTFLGKRKSLECGSFEKYFLDMFSRLNRIKKIARHRNGTVTTEKCLKFQEL
jgi:hypothetical protein